MDPLDDGGPWRGPPQEAMDDYWWEQFKPQYVFVNGQEEQLPPRQYPFTPEIARLLNRLAEWSDTERIKAGRWVRQRYDEDRAQWEERIPGIQALLLAAFPDLGRRDLRNVMLGLVVHPLMDDSPATGKERRARNALAKQLRTDSWELVTGAPTPAEVIAQEADQVNANRPARDAVFRAYRLREGEDEVLPSRFVNYATFITPAGTNDENCLLNELIARYSTCTRPIAAKTIRKFFGPEPTLERFTLFCEKYDLAAHVYSLAGREVWSRTTASNKRKGLAMVAGEGHAYFFTGGNIRDSRPQLEDHEDESEKRERALQAALLNSTKPNFTFRAEEDCEVRSLFYSAAVQEQDERVCADMNKAFHSALWTADAAMRIPVFTPHDDYRVFTPDEELLDTGYYFVGLEVFKSWKTRTDGLLCARISNVLCGCEARWLVLHGYMKLTDIEWVKTSHYAQTVGSVREQISLAAAEVGMPEEDIRQGFALYNGTIGVIRNREKWRDVGSLREIDRDLILATCGSSRVVCEHNSRSLIRIETGKAEFRNMNTRSCYSAVIALCNLAVMKAHQKLQPHAGTLIRVRVDSLTYQTASIKPWTRAVGSLNPGFKVDWSPKRSDGVECARIYHSAADISANISREMDNWVARHIIYHGPPGTGKTVRVRRDHKGQYSYALAPTNMLARQLAGDDPDAPAGETIHHRLQLFKAADILSVCKSHHGQGVWIDELSMINPWIWSAIYVLGWHTPLFLTGDPHQAPPITVRADGHVASDRLPWATGMLLQKIITPEGLQTVDYRNSEELRVLRDGINSQENPHSFFKAWLAEHPQCNGQAVDEADLWSRKTHIVFGNKQRQRVNRQVTAALNMEWSHRPLDVEAEGRPGLCKTADGRAFAFNYSVGLRLCARVSRTSLGFEKSSFWEIIKTPTKRRLGELKIDVVITPHTVCLRRFNHETPASKAGPLIFLDQSQLAHFALGWALTATSSQGMTCCEPAAVHQLDVMLRDGEHRELAYTAITRFKSIHDLLLLGKTLSLEDAITEEIYGLMADGEPIRAMGVDLELA